MFRGEQVTLQGNNVQIDINMSESTRPNSQIVVTLNLC